ncbi:hypothetical protein HDU98_008819 [Podochytrium sp. JEL0797]|nr:hypothetical protein HDU98_008819 [Podochytrium sp. JEL0797]
MSLTWNLTTRQAKDWFKAALAYTLAIAFVFSSFSSWIQPRSYSNVVFVTILQSPAKTIGNFLDSSFLLLLAICISSAVFAFMQAVAGNSFVGLGFILFFDVWIFSTIRTFNVGRFMVFSMVGPLIAFSSLTSLLGITGPNTSDGALFDHNFLISTLKAYLIGLAICSVINFFVFPDFAEPHINGLMTSVVSDISELSSSVISCISGAEITKEKYATGTKTRAQLVAKIQQTFGAIDSTIQQASGEISYTRFSIKNYAKMVKKCKCVASVLFSFHTTLGSAGAQRLLASPEFSESISVQMQQAWSELGVSCKEKFDAVTAKLGGVSGRRTDDSVLEQVLGHCESNAREAILAFQEQRPSSFFNILVDKPVLEEGILPQEVRDNWDKLFQVAFFIIGSKELVKELCSLHTSVLQMPNAFKIRTHLNHFIPLHIFRHNTDTHAPKVSFRSKLANAKNFLLSPASIFGIKCAIAVVCVSVILFSNPTLFKSWYMTGSVTTLLVAVSPSMGQTYLGLPIQIVASALGSSVACAAVKACGKTGEGIIGFAAVLSIPFSYLMLTQKTFVFGFLTLIGFSTYVCTTKSNASNPLFDSPELYLGKLIGINALTLTFAVIFSLVLYPTLARQVLRQRIASILKDLNIFYRKIIVSTVNVPEGVIVVEQDADIKETRNTILSKLVALEPLMAFAAVEPRLESRFESEKYRSVLICLYRLLDRIECMRMSGGDEPFDEDVRRVLNMGQVGSSRFEMQKAIRHLIYVFASTMLTKQPLPPSLPKAAHAREKLANEFILNLLQLYHNDPEALKAAINSETWMRMFSFAVSSREVAFEVDHISPHMKSIFGEFPDIVVGKGAVEDGEKGDADVNAWLLS